jgi:hypothetical protein
VLKLVKSPTGLERDHFPIYLDKVLAGHLIEAGLVTEQASESDADTKAHLRWSAVAAVVELQLLKVTENLVTSATGQEKARCHRHPQPQPLFAMVAEFVAGMAQASVRTRLRGVNLAPTMDPDHLDVNSRSDRKLSGSLQQPKWTTNGATE